MTNTAEVQMKPVSELIASMKAAAEKATPGEWYSDHIDTDGAYGSGEDCREGWRAAGVYSDNGGLLLDSSNSDVAIIREEYDEDGFIAFDETGFKNAEFVVACRPENVLALIAALEQAQEDSEEFTRFKEVMALASQAVKDGSPLDLESLFKGELASAMFATMFAGEFVRHGAKNYLELLYAVPDFGDFTVTIQRKEGKTPCERIAELENDEVRQRLANAEHQLHMAELAKHNLKASRRAQFKKRRAAELRVAELEASKLSVTVPDELTRDTMRQHMMRDDFRDSYRLGWNACRAAMLAPPK